MPRPEVKKNRYEMKSGRESFCKEIDCDHSRTCGTSCSPNGVKCCFFCSREGGCGEDWCSQEHHKALFLIAYEKWLKERNKDAVSDNERLSGKQKKPTRSRGESRGVTTSTPVRDFITETRGSSFHEDWVFERPFA